RILKKSSSSSGVRSSIMKQLRSPMGWPPSSTSAIVVGSLGAGRWLAVLSDMTSPFAGCFGKKATRALAVTLLAAHLGDGVVHLGTPQREGPRRHMSAMGTGDQY